MVETVSKFRLSLGDGFLPPNNFGMTPRDIVLHWFLKFILSIYIYILCMYVYIYMHNVQCLWIR